jgi:hypothetical protein
MVVSIPVRGKWSEREKYHNKCEGDKVSIPVRGKWSESILVLVDEVLRFYMFQSP